MPLEEDEIDSTEFRNEGMKKMTLRQNWQLNFQVSTQATDPNRMEIFSTNQQRPLPRLGEFYHEYIIAAMQCQGEAYIHHCLVKSSVVRVCEASRMISHPDFSANKLSDRRFLILEKDFANLL